MISNSGCTPLPIHRRTNCFKYGCLRRLRLLSPKFFYPNCSKSTMSKPPYFWSMALKPPKLHFNELDSDFRCLATEIGTLSNGFFGS